MTYSVRPPPRLSSSDFIIASASLARQFTMCAPCDPPVTNTTNASAGMKSNLRPEAMSARTGSPVRTVSHPGRCAAVTSKLVATFFAKRDRNSTARPGMVFAS